MLAPADRLEMIDPLAAPDAGQDLAVLVEAFLRND